MEGGLGGAGGGHPAVALSSIITCTVLEAVSAEFPAESGQSSAKNTWYCLDVRVLVER